MVMFLLGTILLISIFRPFLAMPHGIDAGNYFLIALPKLAVTDDVEVVFVLTTLSSNPIQVTLSSPWSNGHVDTPPLKHITVGRLELCKYLVDRAIFPLTETGNRATFRFAGNREFSLVVTIGTSPTKVDIFVAVPVTGWGTMYYAATFDYKPSIVIVTNDGGNAVTIKLAVKQPAKFTASYFGKTFKSGDELTVELRKYEGFTLSSCSQRNTKMGALTGTQVSAVSPIGVISGTCMFENDKPNCDPIADLPIDDADVALAMLMPVETYGKEFITIFTEPYSFIGYVVIIAAEPNTEVMFAVNKEHQFESRNMTKAGEMWVPNIGNAITVILSDKGVSVVYFNNGTCAEGPNSKHASPALFLLIPVTLFYDNYVWVTPLYKSVSVKNFVAVIKPVRNKTIIYLNGTPLKHTTWTNAVGRSSWQVSRFPISEGVHNMYGAQAVYFGCYVYGKSDAGFGYFEAAGFMAVAINMHCHKSTTQNGDLMDNDCDGLIDEERLNGLDDDQDGEIDEDLSKPGRKDGSWGAWDEWECSHNCDDTQLHRHRKCNRPEPQNYGMDCKGGENENKRGTCYVKDICPTKCEKGLWDLNCRKKCTKCIDDCDKFYGNCKECEKGYMFPNESCYAACGPLRFGLGCAGNCNLKCGGECEDKVDGTCPGSWWKYGYLLLILWILPVIGAIIWKYSSCSKKRISEDIDSSFNSTTTSTSNSTV